MEVKLTFYVYVLKRPSGEPFYIGMGSGSRIDHHEIMARRGERTHKANVIRKIWATGDQVGKEIVAHFPSANEAKAAECALIATIGRKDLGAGPLLNRTNGGDGVTGWSKEMRRLHSARTSNGMKTVDVIEKARNNMRKQRSNPAIAISFLKIREYWKKEENRSAQSQRVKEYFADPEVRRRHASRQKEIATKPEVKERHSRAAARRMQAPGRREAHAAFMRELWKQPGFAEKRRATFAAKCASKKNRRSQEMLAEI